MRDKILVIDDVDFNREILGSILSTEYKILSVENGKDALAALEKQKDEIAAILLDLIMPEMDGFEVLERLNQKGVIGKIPVLIISGETAVETQKRCFELGVSDFIGKPFDNMIVKQRVDNIVRYFETQNLLEKKVEEQTLILRKAYRKLQIQTEKLERQNQEIIDMLGNVVEFRNKEDGKHVQRVKGYTRIIAECFMRDYPEYNLTQENIENIVSASALHDIGKIMIPDSILQKPGRLTKDEYEYMKSHSARGCEILDSITGEWDPEIKKYCYEICRHHHERYDGKGYPDGLEGEEIPLSAQFVSVADVYDALVNERCYKEAYLSEQAFHMILRGECGVFSPRLMECFRKVKDEYEKMPTQ